MIKSVIIDGWNLFSYDGVPNDSEEKKTVAVKMLGEYSAEIFLNTKTMMFEFWKNGEDITFASDRVSKCMRLADDWFENILAREKM